ncbi:MAG: LuxR family transcriptional regulator [Nonomuraea sp.]|nr:LuxR family transcriptional regulator [Nonomuraea sp.]
MTLTVPLDRLPQETTGFVGRRVEITTLAAALESARLVTVLGPGGVGKTRLALRTVAEVAAAYPGGVHLLELSGIRDPGLLPGALAARLGIPEDDNRTPMAAVVDYLRDSRALIVLDTCEHLVGACGTLADVLLRSTPGVRVLATSRQALDTPAEHVITLDPLPIEADDGGALELFEQRARSAVPGFAVDEGNRDLALRLCRRLDGIPLAIELATVRLHALSLERLVTRIEKRLDGVTGSRNSADHRHHTLRTTIAWSHDLCTAQERTLWARLSVFAGTFELEVAEQVCAFGELAADDVFEALLGLVEKSIVRRLPDERYRLLDTIREFGAERLAAADEAALARDRHLACFAALAAEHGEHAFDTDQLERTHVLRADHENLQVAFEHATALPDRERAADLAGGLWGYWQLTGRTTEGRLWQERVIELFPEPCVQRAWALVTVAHLCAFQGDPEAGLGYAWQAVECGRAIGERWLEGRGELYVMMCASFLGDAATAYPAGMRTLELLEPVDNRTGLLLMHGVLAWMYINKGDLDLALEHNHRSLEVIGRDSGERWMASYNYFMIGIIRFLQGRAAESARAACTGLRYEYELGDPIGAAYCLELLAWLAAGAGRHERAVWLLGGADVLWRKASERLSGQAVLKPLNAQCEATVRAALDETRYAELRRTGQAHPLELLIASAEADADQPLAAAGDLVRNDGTVLTHREYEVAALAAQGLSNRDISERLVVSKRTVDAHMWRVLTKLAVPTRAHIAARLTDPPPQ